MKVRIALAGDLPVDQQMFGKIDLLLGQLSGYLCKDDANADIQMMVSPAYTGSAWMTWNDAHQFPLCTYYMRDDEDITEKSAQTLRVDTPLRNLLGETMCDRADALLIVWNENVAELLGATWEIMRIAYDRKVPCIWVSSRTHQVYCLWESYYKKYSPHYLSVMSAVLTEDGLQPAPPDKEKGRMLSFWKKLRANYFRKYKADRTVHSSEEDELMKPDFEMEEEVSGGEAVRRLLLHKFRQFDEAAIELNSRFQAMMYQRSVLPFVATIFLAIGFYTETLLVKPIAAFFPETELTLTVLASFLAGAGFLIHGYLNLYVYLLSKSKRVERWQKEFVNNRYLAEILRVLIHFAPYGVALNLRKLCAGEMEIHIRLRHLLDDVEPGEQNLNRRNVLYVLQHVKEMLADQMAYHETSVGRYKNIVNSLEKFGQILFYSGLFLAVGRGCLQFLLAVIPIVSNTVPFEVLFSENFYAKVTQIDWSGMVNILRSFLNMLALLIPAWAGYFTTKVQQNNFRYNLDNHQRMLSRLRQMHERVENAMRQEDIPIEVFNIMIEELAELMLLEDTISWQQQYRNTAIKPL